MARSLKLPRHAKPGKTWQDLAERERLLPSAAISRGEMEQTTSITARTASSSKNASFSTDGQPW
jgi:hypothetical protein